MEAEKMISDLYELQKEVVVMMEKERHTFEQMITLLKDFSISSKDMEMRFSIKIHDMIRKVPAQKGCKKPNVNNSSITTQQKRPTNDSFPSELHPIYLKNYV